ncbi:MAG: MotA/TolQ/ExbB proton channel family protein [Deltaproteobacteria bacterium]|nr:MAG: MotA/TolQ/ExbB proton channel family protein [Deltaproteobacteria bacterium]
MINQLFLGLSLAGSVWVLYFLSFLSILSLALIFERWWFYKKASRGLDLFREKIRAATRQKNWEEVRNTSKDRLNQGFGMDQDMESSIVDALVNTQAKPQIESLQELAQDAIIRAKLNWDRNLSLLATIGSNAPFIGLFGTVLGIIKAFHDLSQQNSGPQSVTSGISEALVATAIGLLVAIPAVIAFNLFQRRVKTAVSEAEALKSFMIGKMVE